MPKPTTCDGCGGALRYSHRQHRGRAGEVSVYRCPSCGVMVEGPALSTPTQWEKSQGQRSERRRKSPVDEGPPPNPVLDANAADRLRDLFNGNKSP